MCGSSGDRIGDSVKSVSLVPAVGVHADGMRAVRREHHDEALRPARWRPARAAAPSPPARAGRSPRRRRRAGSSGARAGGVHHGDASGGRLRNAAMRTVARTIFLKSPPPFVPLNARRQLVDGAQVARRLLGAAERVAEPLRRRAARDLGAAGQARGQAGHAVERAVDVGARQHRRSRRPAGRRRCRASGRRRRSARTRSRSDPSAGGTSRSAASAVCCAKRWRVDRRGSTVGGRTTMSGGGGGGGVAEQLGAHELAAQHRRRLVGLGVLGQERALRQQAGGARRDRGRRAGSRRRPARAGRRTPPDPRRRT